MLYPAMSKLLEHVNSRYLLVNVVAHRARQLSIESEMNHEPLQDKPVTIAINEVARGGLTATLKDMYQRYLHGHEGVGEHLRLWPYEGGLANDCENCRVGSRVCH